MGWVGDVRETLQDGLVLLANGDLVALALGLFFELLLGPGIVFSFAARERACGCCPAGVVCVFLRIDVLGRLDFNLSSPPLCQMSLLAR